MRTSEFFVKEFVDYKLSTRMELADRVLDDLIPLAKEDGDILVSKNRV